MRFVWTERTLFPVKLLILYLGIVTSVLAKEGRLSTVSDVVGGAWKVFFFYLKAKCSYDCLKIYSICIYTCIDFYLHLEIFFASHLPCSSVRCVYFHNFVFVWVRGADFFEMNDFENSVACNKKSLL